MRGGWELGSLVGGGGGGGALKKIAPREHFWGISCENHDFTPKNHIFSNSHKNGGNFIHFKLTNRSFPTIYRVKL
jgi:hypothetical protein